MSGEYLSLVERYTVARGGLCGPLNITLSACRLEKRAAESTAALRAADALPKYTAGYVRNYRETTAYQNCALGSE